jgi:hypothetical protein
MRGKNMAAKRMLMNKKPIKTMFLLFFAAIA